MPFIFNCHYQAAPLWLDTFFGIEMVCSSFLLDPQQIHLTPPTNITTAIATSKEKSVMSLKPPTQSPVCTLRLTFPLSPLVNTSSSKSLPK
jgi:hypothetical protein